MNESLVNHLFLPQYLPSSAEDDYLIQNNYQNEHTLLKCMKKYLKSLDPISMLPVFPIVIDCIDNWSILQNPQTLSDSNIQSIIHSLPAGAFLPIYFHAQNAAILIEIDENNSQQPLISAWQVLLPSIETTSSVLPHLSNFPVTTCRLKDRSQLTSKAHCELLVDFAQNTIDYSKSWKASRQVAEIREVPVSHYVCQWWIQHFEDIQLNSNPPVSISFQKKHRDHIRWNSALLPFRRSGLWMTMKVVLQTILSKRLGDVGSIVYKLLITHFLSYIIIHRTPESTDLLVHCIRKIGRRLDKIQCALALVNVNHIEEWIRMMRQEIEINIDQVFPKLDWQRSIECNSESTDSLIDNSDIHRHSCMKLRNYLSDESDIDMSGPPTDPKNYQEFDDVNHVDYIPSYNTLTTKLNYTIEVALTRMEVWVELRIDQWLNQSSLFISGTNRFEILLRFYGEYQSVALNHYLSNKDSTDPIGYSRLIITSLTIIRAMHQRLCQDERFQRLQHHAIYIPNLIDLFEFLVLPTRKNMIRSHDLYKFFSDFNSKSGPDLLTNVNSADAFGVHFAGQTPSMIRSIEQINAQADRDEQDKRKEVNDAKERYRQLMNSISHLSCSCTYDRWGWSQCQRCRVCNQANSIRVQIFERPLPRLCTDASAVIFELQMPIEIRSYREILWQFANRPKPNPSNQMHEWLNVRPHQSKLGPFYTGPSQRNVKLVSETKSATETHYSYPPSIESTPVEGFLFENSLKVQISPTAPTSLAEECRFLTPQIHHSDYKSLQFTIESTQFKQNDVIAQLSNCPARLKSTQFVEYGSFRSGHRLQWWNLLAVLEMDSLSIAEESVAIMIIHSILQYGPLSTVSDAFSDHWCPESHKQLLEDHFVDEFILRLERHLNDCELNWQNELVLMVITIITMRILTICKATKQDRVVGLAMKCRRTGEKWIELISHSVQRIAPSAFAEVAKLRLKMVNIGISCVLSFSTDQDRIQCLISSNDHIVSLLKAATTVHDNIILNKSQFTMSTFMQNLKRMSERVLVMVQPTVTTFLKRTLFQSLSEFAVHYWAVIKQKGSSTGQWKKRMQDVDDGWYDCQCETRWISIDCIRGTFLVDGMTIGFLPDKIIANELFVRVFENHIFEVQAATRPNTYISKCAYHNERVHYEFHFDDQTKHLTINEQHRQGGEIFRLIPHSCFESELPDPFVSEHSHWLNRSSEIVEFRPVRFQTDDFLDSKPYVLSLHTGYVSTTDEINKQNLINQSSRFFESLFNKYFNRLDGKPYVYMMQDNTSHKTSSVHIYLSRLRIAFKRSGDSSTITSREYSDMCIEEDQWFGTLTGLQSGLLLTPLLWKNQTEKNYPYRKLIVPFGNIVSVKNTTTKHQTVTIERSSSTLFPQQYFVFILNDRLQILQSTDSPTGWLYLALLHAMTSHPLPDKYMGMTGMERAFQLLNSAGCWSDQPFDALSQNILVQIGAISPKVDYYPKHLTAMVKIDWNTNSIPYSMQHFGYYLLAKG